MGEIIAQINIKREKGYLYYVSFDEKGYLLIGKAKLLRGGGRRKKNVKNVQEEEKSSKFRRNRYSEVGKDVRRSKIKAVRRRTKKSIRGI